MVIIDLQKLFHESGEIEFNYNKKHYFMACYSVKGFFKRSKVEYRFIDDKNELQKFDDIDSLLDTIVDEKKLRDILDEIEII